MPSVQMAAGEPPTVRYDGLNDTVLSDTTKIVLDERQHKWQCVFYGEFTR